MKLVKLTALATALFLCIIVFQTRSSQLEEKASAPKATIGSAENLNIAYQKWKRRLAAYDGAAELVVPIGWAKGLSETRTPVGGTARINLQDSKVAIKLQNMNGADALDAWLVDNVAGDGRTVRPEAGDHIRYLGRLEQVSAGAMLNAELEQDAFLTFEIDAIVITRAGIRPEDEGLMYGMPGLFQRLYRDEFVKQYGTPDLAARANLLALAAPAAHASEAGASLSVFQTLVEDGEDIFFNETFDGNGRTCGTCHPAENNFTIDPAFIASLPDDDPLFVAENNPDLNFDLNGGMRFENPVLMRERALIVVNADGFEDLANKFVMRSVSHVFAQALSITPSTADGSDPGKLHRTGWDGDGSPGTGTLREFAIGAVIQHNPLTLNRVEGVDFRLPTDFELDALEAFQLSLGRQEELDLQNMTFLDPSVNGGKARFLGQDKCHQCHGNGGAIATTDPNRGTNANFNTSVEDGVNPADRIDEPMPRDGGAGHEGTLEDGFGDGKFNVPSIVEAADTPPYFHDNSKESLRNAVVFYATDTFNNSPAGQAIGGIVLGTGAFEIEDFLRVINTLDNLRSAEQYISQAMQLGLNDGLKPLRLAKIDLEDAETVLDRGGLHGTERAEINFAFDLLTDAEGAATTGSRDDLLNQALGLLDDARDGMVIIEGDGGPGNNPPTASFTFSTSDLTANFTDTSTDSDGSIASWSWDFGGDGTSTAQHPSHTFSAGGTFNVSLTVTDNEGATNTTSQNVTVSSGGAGATMHIESITTAIVRDGSTRMVEATFLILDDNGNPVSGATVDGSFGGDLSGTDSGVTDTGGEAVLTSDAFTARPFDFGICADAVTHGSLTYDPGQNSDPSFDCATAGPDAGVARNNETPESFTLHPNFPNPFNPSTEIRFTLEESGPVKISIFNALGQEVRVLADGHYDRGEHRITWEGKDNAGASLATGSYLYQLRFNSRTATRTMTLIK